MAPPIRAHLRTVVFFHNGGIGSIWIVYTRRKSVGILRVTGSLLHLVLACRLAVLCDCSSCDYLQVPRFCVDALLQVVCVVGNIHWTIPQDYIVEAMSSENSQSGADWRGIHRVHVQMERSGISSDIAGGSRFRHHMCSWD